jgi:hypothetical protein
VAVTTRINEFPTWYGAGKNPKLFGYSLPPHIRAVDHSFNVASESVTIAWSIDKDKPWHHMDVEMPMTEEKVIALIVAMKLSC